MVQKIHPYGVIWGAFFPPPANICPKKSAECSVPLYSSHCIVLQIYELLTVFLFQPVQASSKRETTNPQIIPTTVKTDVENLEFENTILNTTTNTTNV